MEEVCAFANLASRPVSHLPDARICDDPYGHLAPVASFRPDVLGRFDLAGNAAELTSTCLSEASGVGDALAMNQRPCRVWRVVGGSYESAPEVLDPRHPVALETAHLVWDEASPATGFRVFREAR
jgi:formylglycine-generating enzyme required for sulfatase activity